MTPECLYSGASQPISYGARGCPAGDSRTGSRGTRGPDCDGCARRARAAHGCAARRAESAVELLRCVGHLALATDDAAQAAPRCRGAGRHCCRSRCRCPSARRAGPRRRCGRTVDSSQAGPPSHHARSASPALPSAAPGARRPRRAVAGQGRANAPCGRRARFRGAALSSSRHATGRCSPRGSPRPPGHRRHRRNP